MAASMSKVTLDKFLALVVRSGLVAEDRLAPSVVDWQRHTPEDFHDNAHSCADHLVDAGLLTRWQAKKLLDGRHRGFQLGKYLLLDHLGSGGMSSVYLARHVLMQRLVAIKVLPAHRVDDSSYLARFHLEGQAAAALDHRNIVRVYDLDNEDKVHYLVMEYIEGRDLDALVSHDGPLDFHTAADYVAQAATGLQHAHDAGLVHRDIKPANLLVDRQGTVKILDMGLAKFAGAAELGAELARDEQVLGTADYMAPEQTVNSSTVDQRADLYGLGCTLYFLLTGHPPFVGGSALEQIVAHQRQMPPSVLVDRPDAPEPLVAICTRLMEKSPLDRYQSANEVRDALVAWLADEAAAGRIVERSDAGARYADLSTRARGASPGSRINLISGSSPELDRPLSAAQPGGAAPVAGSSSEVFTAESRHGTGRTVDMPPELPLAPPIVAPPAPMPAILLSPAPPRVIGPATSIPIAVAAPFEMPVAPTGALPGVTRAKSADSIRWVWVVVLSGMILGAALLALFAWPA